MGIKRGTWKPETSNKNASTQPNSRIKPVNVEPGKSNSEVYLQNRDPQKMSGQALNSLSEHRQNEMLVRGTASQSQSEHASPVIVYSNSYKKALEVRKQYMGKTAATSIGAGSFNVSGGGDVVRQAPEVYSPLFQIANLQLPRDRVTMNAWNRNFYDTHPLVRNCINLHATYPLGKINIRCKDKKVEQFFEDMIQEMDLLGILQNVALEYWKSGECIPYADLDADKGVWKDILVQNPDYVHVKRAVLGGEPIISLRPDAVLQRLVTSNNPADVQLRKQISPEIIHHVRKGNNIPLDNFHVSHLKMTSCPYDIRGTSMIVSIYKDLMLYDKLRECHDEKTEVLTDQGFKKYWEVIGENKEIKEGFEVACFNPDTEKVEYHKPTGAHLSDYSGDMYQFKGKKVDIKVTPDHNMWLSRKLSKGWSDWELKKSKEMSMGTKYRFRSIAKWEGDTVESVEVCGKTLPIKDYLSVLGYIISEGCVYRRDVLNPNGRIYEQGSVSVSQNIYSDCYDDIKESFVNFACLIDKQPRHYVDKNEVWSGSVGGKEITHYFIDEIGIDGKCKSMDKQIPRWVLDLNADLLKVLLRTLVNGDGSDIQYKHKNGYKYHTTSEELADDVSELVFKCGYAPTKYISKKTINGYNLFTVGWSETNNGKFPNVYGNPKYRDANINIVPYSGKVWCFEVPTGLFITRRNGLVTIQGNSKFAQADNLINPITLISVGGNADGEYRATEADLENWRQTFESAQYDKDFKIISHAGVKVERIGASGSIIDIGPDMNFIIDNILYGLMTPKAVLTQEGSSYSSASIGLEVLKQRYEAFRNMMAKWLVMKIFAPISEIQDFYEYQGGDKKLIVPEVDWNQMILFDMDNYIQVLQNLHQKDQQTGMRTVSKDTLFRSLGLDAEDERRKARDEMIQEQIFAKEQAIVQTMTLSALRAIKSDEDIIEQTQIPLPGTPGSSSEEASMMPGAGGGGMGPMMDLGLPSLPGGGFGGAGVGMGPGALPELGGPGAGMGAETPPTPGAGGGTPAGV